jgi:hypothetical protein
VALQRGPSGTAIYLTDITAATAGVRDFFDGTPVTVVPFAVSWALRNHGGSFALSGGAVDEWAVFYGELYSGASYTAPSAPLTGTETNIHALYHCDSNVNDAVGS